MAVSMIDVALVAVSCASLIISFQTPLEKDYAGQTVRMCLYRNTGELPLRQHGIVSCITDLMSTSKWAD